MSPSPAPAPGTAGEAVESFYDGMADTYHLMFDDWRSEVARQGQTLSALIGELTGLGAKDILDCTCGIGTQAIGLALAGHEVTASDLSTASVERTRREGQRFGVSLQSHVADLLQLDATIKDSFDVVLAGDNALSHFFDDESLVKATTQMAGRLRKGGLLLASIRDYDRILDGAGATVAAGQQLPGEYGQTDATRPRTTMPRVFDGRDGDGQRIVFQVWDWAADGSSYRINQFFLRQQGTTWTTTQHVTRFRALRRETLTRALEAAGLREVRWHMPETSGFYQPVVSARR